MTMKTMRFLLCVALLSTFLAPNTRAKPTQNADLAPVQASVDIVGDPEFFIDI